MTGTVATYLVLFTVAAFLAINGARLVREHLSAARARRRARRAFALRLRERERP